jgi:flagellar basal-body rod protein FlgF
MERGTYSAASGGLLQLKRLDIVTNNLANINSPGFKQQIIVSSTQKFEDTLAKSLATLDTRAESDHEQSPGVLHVESVTDFALGSIRNTGANLDVALRHPLDFFVVQTASGPELTRAGNFSLDAQGTLVTQDGYEVQGNGGAITVTGAGVTISDAGRVRSGGEEFGSLQVVRVEDGKLLERVGDNRFRIRDGAAQPNPVEPDLISQSLEMSNISPVSGIIELITANRGFEMYSKAAQTIDGINQIAISQVGRKAG